MFNFVRQNLTWFLFDTMTVWCWIWTPYICRVYFIILYRLLLELKLCKSNYLYDAIIQFITCTNVIVPVITCTTFVEKKIITCTTQYLWVIFVSSFDLNVLFKHSFLWVCKFGFFVSICGYFFLLPIYNYLFIYFFLFVMCMFFLFSYGVFFSFIFFKCVHVLVLFFKC